MNSAALSPWSPTCFVEQEGSRQGARALHCTEEPCAHSPVLTVLTPVPAAPRHRLRAQQIARPGAATAELCLLNLQLCVWL